MGVDRMKKSTIYSEMGVQILKTTSFSISTLLGTLKIHIPLDKMVLS